ncbi:hypothetical protein [Bartonella heixiaziensis]|uniref:hypothetical protein n=1 Tax=Bartonella heixiaziensis TaxID=1461000 RepID=UPI0039089FD6
MGKNVTCRQIRIIQQGHYVQRFVDEVDRAHLGLAERVMILTKSASFSLTSKL